MLLFVAIVTTATVLALFEYKAFKDYYNREHMRKVYSFLIEEREKN